MEIIISAFPFSNQKIIELTPCLDVTSVDFFKKHVNKKNEAQDSQNLKKQVTHVVRLRFSITLRSGTRFKFHGSNKLQ